MRCGEPPISTAISPVYAQALEFSLILIVIPINIEFTTDQSGRAFRRIPPEPELKHLFGYSYTLEPIIIGGSVEDGITPCKYYVADLRQYFAATFGQAPLENVDTVLSRLH